MATSTQTRSRLSTSAVGGASGSALFSAAVAGAALAITANLGRKLAVQAFSARKGTWVESLAEEHKMVLALFDKALETSNTDSKKRALLLMQIGHALDKHSFAEEHVIYPALREANERTEAEQLENDHGEVKTFLFRLHNMDTSAPEWLTTVREFRESVATHAAMEEEEVFPRLQAQIGEKLNARLTSEVNKAGFFMA